jgi:alpha,alpha-trehalase
MDRRNFISDITLATGALAITPAGTFGLDRMDQTSKQAIISVLEYIRDNWDKSIYKDEPGKGFLGVDLPFSYAAPSIKGQGHFTFLCYWDIYFTNLGLLRNGKEEQAKNNIKNLLWLIKEQGYIPGHVGVYNRSQSPYLQFIVKDYFALVKNDSVDFWRECADGVRKEYQFWMTARYSKTGLNHNKHHDDDKGCIDFYNKHLISRMKFDALMPDDQKSEIGGQYMAEAETWDFCQRYSGHSMDYNPVDLNALLFGYEEFLFEAAKKNNWFLKDFYQQRADKRKKLINDLLWNDNLGWYFDYDFKNKKQSEVYSLSGLQPLFMGLASQEQADKMVKNLHLFERDFGVATTNETIGCRAFQWAYPVVWPPLVYLTVMSLDKYGFKDDANRIAKKFIDVNTSLFKEHGMLFEKTDVETGDLSNTEYKSAPLMGWTAGVFVALAEYLSIKE